ncbi:MAG TPA: hypothetical protein VK932_12375 [Kofleriaceae bacterium]|nr:hypothetical protein [Kofleriaceae bacterium]
MWSERLSSFLYRHRFVLLAICVLHVFWMHYRVLGFWSWDGFGHRGFPIVELAQHGDMGKGKFNEWSLVGYIPFVELFHIPFLLVFGLKGFIIGFPLVVLPLCVAAVYLLVRELTGDPRAGFFGGFAYFALPVINQQPFSAYIDFAVAGILAFLLYAILRVRSSERPLAPYLQLVLATFLFTMARSQGPYMLAVLFPILAYALFCERAGFRIRIADRRKLLLSAAAIVVGASPAIGVQIYKLVTYGSPIAPMKFQLLGLESATGVSVEQYFKLAGLGGTDLKSLGVGFFEGWIWKGSWPLGAFYDSRRMAAGLLFVLAVILFPVFWRRSTRVERALLAAGLLASLMARDFAIPRCAYTTVVALSVVIGRAMATLAASRRGRPLFWFAFAVMCVHLLRPEFDYLQLRDREAYLTPRLNIAGTPGWRRSRWEVTLYPDGGHRLFILDAPGNNFVLQLYGQELSNVVLGTIPKDAIGPGCSGLAPYLAAHPDALFVDDHDHAKDCKRECVAPKSYCLMWRIHPEAAAAAP